MLKELETDLAELRGIPLSSVSIADGHERGFTDMHILAISSQGQLVSTLVHQYDLHNLQRGSVSARLEIVIRTVLSELELQLERWQQLLQPDSDYTSGACMN
ncbi:MAG: hypothetical protein PHY09_14075 [Desulfuromonadaceae bacterium]|nr:hypothetical protein [Desulfuromonadaceae bacterium]MDD5107749.1 hypothetical protein [Desulfuromonadaceae bacterium]